jgi:hypothetical protein
MRIGKAFERDSNRLRLRLTRLSGERGRAASERRQKTKCDGPYDPSEFP